MAQEMDVVSSEGTDQTLRPKLTISYDDNTIAVSRKVTGHRYSGTVTLRSEKNRFYLNGSALTAPVAISVTTPAGRSVYSGRLHPGGTVSLSGVSPGIVMVKYRAENGQEYGFTALIQ
jgi:hypothetical protein